MNMVILFICKQTFFEILLNNNILMKPTTVFFFFNIIHLINIYWYNNNHIQYMINGIAEDLSSLNIDNWHEMVWDRKRWRLKFRE
jgi:hypothetical protein